MKKVLITGASGLIGTRLSDILGIKGYEVRSLGRNRSSTQAGHTSHFEWSIQDRKMDERAFEGVSAVIHLAGANLNSRWTKAYKKEIVESRVQSAEMIYDFLKKGNHQVETFISSSAVGYYGDCGAEVLTEEHGAGNDFLAGVCIHWEAMAKKIGSLGIREVRCRNGIVLAREGGVLPELTRTFPIGVAGYFDKPNLYYPWIHIDDTCGFIVHALENKDITGPYNVTAPNPILIKDLVKEIIRAKKSRAILVPAPPFVLKAVLGELSSIILSSARCSCEKMISSGYVYHYTELGSALDALCSKK